MTKAKKTKNKNSLMVVIVWYVFVSTLTVFSATGVVIVVVELGEVDKHCLFAGL